jgi:hypothetical protein
VPEPVPPGVVVVSEPVPPVVPVPEPVPPGVVVVSEPPPVPPPPWSQADKAKGTMAKVRAKALAQTVLGKLEGFIVVFPFKVVNSRSFLNIQFQKQWNYLSSF